jgi:hypothetical protein
METHPQGIPTQLKTSGMAVASFIMAFLPGLNCIGFILAIIALVQIKNKANGLKGTGLAVGGLIISIIIWPVVGVIITLLGGLGGSMMLPALAKAKSKANRIKCVNNLGMINRAHMAFAQDNGERYPWQLSDSGMQNHVGSNYGLAQTAGGVFGLTAMKSELQTPKILISPCDPERMAANERLQEDWTSYDTRAGNPVPSDGISYVLCEGAETMRPSTILAATRNLSSDDLATARWLGANSDWGNPNVIAGLDAGQGQITMADGSSKQSSDLDIGSGGGVVGRHSSSMGGLTKGPASTRIFR